MTVRQAGGPCVRARQTCERGETIPTPLKALAAWLDHLVGLFTTHRAILPINPGIRIKIPTA
jgi:hypothetical protein